MDRIAWTDLNIPDDRKVSDLWVAPYVAAAVTAAIDTGVMSHLAKGSAPAAMMARELQLHATSLESLLRVLVAQGFVRESQVGFDLEEAARSYLVPESPLSKVHELAGHFRTPEHVYLSKRLRDLSRKPRTFSDALTDGGIAPADLPDFIKGMDSLIKAPAIAVARSGAFREVRQLLDVGGGSGAFCTAVTAHEPNLHATVFDLSAVCDQARDLAAARHASRIEFHGGDFFEDAWPTMADAIFFSNVLHDWDHERIKILLRSARRAVQSPGRLFVLEVLLDEDRNGPLMATVFHMQMQMSFDAGQLTLSNLATLLAATGWAPPKVVARFGYYALVQAGASV